MNTVRLAISSGSVTRCKHLFNGQQVYWNLPQDSIQEFSSTIAEKGGWIVQLKKYIVK